MSVSKYESIINLPHHVSKDHPPLPAESFAAQFSPFAALTGYGDMIDETARYTDEERELEDSGAAELDKKLGFIRGMLKKGDLPEITVTYFEPDSRKSGGARRTYTGKVVRVDFRRKTLLFADGAEIPARYVEDISGDFQEGSSDFSSGVPEDY